MFTSDLNINELHISHKTRIFLCCRGRVGEQRERGREGEKKEGLAYLRYCEARCGRLLDTLLVRLSPLPESGRVGGLGVNLSKTMHCGLG